MQGHHSKTSTSTTASVSKPSATIPLPDLPLDIIIPILKLLPVKSILRFKCVSKDWLSLLSSPKFVSIHREETSRNPQNHSFIIHSYKDGSHRMSLLNVNATEREPISLFNTLPLNFGKTYLVGCINGLICLCGPPSRHRIILWNPAMNLYKVIKLPISDEDTRRISVGFAYDSVNDDYKIIRIDYRSPDAPSRSGAEVYSARLDCWKRVHLDFKFLSLKLRSIVVAKGIPYWRELIAQGNVAKLVLVYYDMRTGSFKHVSLPKSARHGCKQYVEWKGHLGMILLRTRVTVDILVYDEMGMCWNKISRHGPIGFKIKEPLQCSKDGVILSETEEGKLMLYDHVTHDIKTFCILAALKHTFYDASSYTESLVTFKGMEHVKELDKDQS